MLADIEADTEALILAEMLGEADIEAEIEALREPEMLADIEALMETDSLALIEADTLAETEAEIETDALALMLADTLAEIDADIEDEAEILAEMLAEILAEIDADIEALREPDRLAEILDETDTEGDELMLADDEIEADIEGLILAEAEIDAEIEEPTAPVGCIAIDIATHSSEAVKAKVAVPVAPVLTCDSRAAPPEQESDTALLSSIVIPVVPDGYPVGTPSTFISSSSAPNILNTKQSSFVVVTERQVGVAEKPFPCPLMFIGVETSWPVKRIMNP